MPDLSFDEAVQAVADAFVETETPEPAKVAHLQIIIDKVGDGSIRKAIGMLCMLASMSEKPFG